MPRRDAPIRTHKRPRRRRVVRLLERIILGAGMSLVAFFIERRLIKAIKTGSLSTKPAREPSAGEAALTAEPGGPAHQGPAERRPTGAA